ncbi:uncharacterized protein LOC130509804 [Raphanus sativus]|uniref:Uncharacterized protein LOC130509804 n=1 Tax=Raphanus sativus TaxID=3726 RepID=A0A9W3DE38_RAPSA|nr:uncharacterized protein LOC130509804 [Raphanus sativus]
MLGFQLDIKKKYELWCLVGPEPLRFSLIDFEKLTGLNCEYIEDFESPYCPVTPEMSAFWAKLGVNINDGPSTDQIISALKRCKEWSRDDRKRLAYLAIFAGYIEGKKVTTSTRASCYTIDGFVQAFQSWVYTALPELGAGYGNPVGGEPAVPLLAYSGGKGRRWFQQAICSQEDEERPRHRKKAEERPRRRKKAEECPTPRPQKKARLEATAEASEEASEREEGREREEARLREEGREEAREREEGRSDVCTEVIGMTKEELGRNFKDLADALRQGFGTCLAEIKHLSDRIGVVEKKFGITPAPSKQTQEPGSERESVNGAKEKSGKKRKERKEDPKEDPKKRMERKEDPKEDPKKRMERKEDPKEDPKKRNEDQKEDPKEDQKEDPKEDASEVAKDDPEEDASEVGNEGASFSKVPSLVVAEEVEEPSVLLLDKENSTLSDKVKERARYESKRDAAHLELQRDAALAVQRGRSERTRKLAPTQSSLYKENSTAKMIIPNSNKSAFTPFHPLDKATQKLLIDHCKTCP